MIGGDDVSANSGANLASVASFPSRLRRRVAPVARRRRCVARCVRADLPRARSGSLRQQAAAGTAAPLAEDVVPSPSHKRPVNRDVCQCLGRRTISLIIMELPVAPWQTHRCLSVTGATSAAPAQSRSYAALFVALTPTRLLGSCFLGRRDTSFRRLAPCARSNRMFRVGGAT